MSGMKVFETNIAAGTDTQKVNYSLDLEKIDLHIGSGSAFDKVTFDSLLTSLKSETIDRNPAPQKDYNAEQAKRNQEYSDRNKTIDNRIENKRPEENYSDPEMTDRINEAGETNDSYRADMERPKSEYTDSKSQLDEKGDSADTADVNKGKEQSGDADKKGNAESNAVKIESLLFELVQSKESTIRNNGEISDNEEAAIHTTVKETGQGLKNGALLKELLNGASDEHVENATIKGNEIQGQAGLKTIDVLKDLSNVRIAGTEQTQTDSAARSESGDALSAKAVKSEGDLKLGELPNNAADSKADDIEREMKSAGAKPVNPQSEETENELEGLIRKIDTNGSGDKKTDMRQEQVKEHKIQDFMAQKDIQEHNNAKASVSKEMPGMVENLLRESGARPNVNATTKRVSENRESNNISLVNDISAKGNGAKNTTVHQTGNISKPTAFADIVNKIVYVAKGDNKLGVTLDHKDLGLLNIKLSLDKGVVNVHINTADKVAKEFVESNMQQIVESLSKNGVSVGGFSVGLKNHQNSEGFSNGNSKRNEKAFSLDGIQAQEYVRAGANAYSDNSQVSIFA